MEIIKHGDLERLDRIKTFECSACGCVFKANKTEYNSGQQYNEVYYYCRCPDCESYAYESQAKT